MLVNLYCHKDDHNHGTSGSLGMYIATYTACTCTSLGMYIAWHVHCHKREDTIQVGCKYQGINKICHECREAPTCASLHSWQILLIPWYLHPTCIVSSLLRSSNFLFVVFPYCLDSFSVLIINLRIYQCHS